MVTNGIEASEKGRALRGCTHTPPSANLITQETWEASEGGTSQEVSIPVPACVFMCSCKVTASWAWGRDADVAEVPSLAGMLGCEEGCSGLALFICSSQAVLGH